MSIEELTNLMIASGYKMKVTKETDTCDDYTYLIIDSGSSYCMKLHEYCSCENKACDKFERDERK